MTVRLSDPGGLFQTLTILWVLFYKLLLCYDLIPYMYLCNCQCSNTGSKTLLCLTPPQQFKETKAVFAKKIQAMFFASQNGSTKEEENVTGHISTDVIFSVLHNTHRIILSAFAEKLKPVTFTFA